MAKFTDLVRREWTISLTSGDLRRVREQAGLDLGKALTNTDRLAELLFGDVEMFGKVVWVLIEKQANALSITPEEFADGFDRDTFESASSAITDAILDFTQPRTVAEKKKEAIRGLKIAVEKVVVSQLDAALTTLNSSVGNSPGSPVSTPNTEPSAS